MIFLPLVFLLSPGAPKLQFVPDQEATLTDFMLQRSSKESSCAPLCTQMKEWMFCFYLPFMSAIHFICDLQWFKTLGSTNGWKLRDCTPSDGFTSPLMNTYRYLILCAIPFRASEAAALGNANDKPTFYLNCLVPPVQHGEFACVRR